jgi:hypothetical protein
MPSRLELQAMHFPSQAKSFPSHDHSFVSSFYVSMDLELISSSM